MNAKQFYQEIELHLLQDEAPSHYLNSICDTPQFREYPFRLIQCLKGIPQSPKYHPEGDAWIHTMLVVNQAAQVKHKSTNPKVFMWAALLHDIGKATTTRTRKGKITSYDHDRAGAKLAEEFLDQFNLEQSFQQAIVHLIYYHMHILYVTKNLPFADIEGLKRNTNVNDVALLGWCDRMGRTNANPKQEKETIDQFLHRLKVRTTLTLPKY